MPWLNSRLLYCTQLPDDIFDLSWSALRVSVLVREAVGELNGSMIELETRYLKQLQDDKDVVSAEIDTLKRQMAVRAPWCAVRALQGQRAVCHVVHHATYAIR